MDIIPFKYDPVQHTPKQFEQEVRHFLAELGTHLTEFEVKHNQVLQTHDGEYQIDVLAAFEALGAEFRVLIECKHTKRPVEREVVQALRDKLQSIGAHKGMIFSTAGFQSGALRYAKVHGIALVHIMDGRAVYLRKGMGASDELPSWGRPYESRLTWVEDKDGSLMIKDGSLMIYEAAGSTTTLEEIFNLTRTDTPTNTSPTETS